MACCYTSAGTQDEAGINVFTLLSEDACLDITNVSFMDSVGMVMLLRAFKILRNQGNILRIRVRNASQPERVLHRKRLESIVEIIKC